MLWLSVGVANIVNMYVSETQAKGTVYYLILVLIIVQKQFLVQFSYLIRTSWKKTVPEVNFLTGTPAFTVLILIDKV